MTHTARPDVTSGIHTSDLSPVELLQAHIHELETRNAREASARHTAETALHNARSAAACAEETKTRFLAMMSHELRTPLTGVIGYSELLGAEVLGPLTAKQLDAVARIRASSWHLVGIIDEILTLSRMEAGREQAYLDRADIAPIVRDVVGLVSPQAEAAGLRVCCIGADESAIIRTDAGKVRQILSNLAGNAVKFTASGAVTVEIDRSDAGSLGVHIRDTGAGIAPADQQRVFDAFTQLDDSATRASPGVGLGLAICRRLALLLGGDVTLDSTPGSGSTFTLRLPRN
jgi:signal transduction histidine kinase